MRAIDLPAYIADTLRELASPEYVVNATDILMHPDHGLRTFCSPAEIAYFEYTSVLASEGMRRIIFGLRDGMSDHEAAQIGRLQRGASGLSYDVRNSAESSRWTCQSGWRPNSPQ